MAAHLHSPPPRVPDVVPGLSMQMDQVIAVAMAKDPAHRFGSARGLADAAAAALNDRTVQLTAPWQPIPSAQANSFSPPPSAPTMPAPFYQQPYFSPPPKRRRGRRIAAVLSAVAVVAGAVVAVVALTAKSDHHTAAPPPTSSTTSTTTSAPPAPPVTTAALSGLLLPPEQVAGIVGADALVQESLAVTTIDDSPKVVEKDCIGVAAPDEHLVYADSGWTAARSQALRNAGEGPRAFAVIQAVIAFPSAEQANKIVAEQKSQWTKCSGRTLTFVFPTPPSPQLWTVGKPDDTDGTLKMTQELKDGGGMKCQRALAAHSNVAVDVSACRYDVTNQAADIVNAIAGKISH
jgi:serine/threonine-protein kinase